MQGLILNEEGSKTYPYYILIKVADYVKTLKFRVSNVECYADGFPFTDEDQIVTGSALLEVLEEYKDELWCFGAISGFPLEVTDKEIRKKAVFDMRSDQPYLMDKLHHAEPKAVFELFCFDSTGTFVVTDDEDVINKLKEAYPLWEDLEKYMC